MADIAIQTDHVRGIMQELGRQVGVDRATAVVVKDGQGNLRTFNYTPSSGDVRSESRFRELVARCYIARDGQHLHELTFYQRAQLELLLQTEEMQKRAKKFAHGETTVFTAYTPDAPPPPKVTTAPANPTVAKPTLPPNVVPYRAPRSSARDPWQRRPTT